MAGRPAWLRRFTRSDGQAAGPPTGPPDAPSPLAVRARLFARALSREITVRVRQAVRLALLLVEAVIAVRILFVVAGANMATGFGSLIRNVSDPFVRPFKDVFMNGTVNGHPFEVNSLLAMGVYAAAAYLLLRIVRLIFTPGR